MLISKPVCLHARPTAVRSSSFSKVSEQRLVTLLERRRRKYLLAHKEDNGKKDHSNELEGACTDVLSNLGVDESSCAEIHSRRPSPTVYETHFRHSSIELVSEVMLPTKTRTRAKNLKSKPDIISRIHPKESSRSTVQSVNHTCMPLYKAPSIHLDLQPCIIILFALLYYNNIIMI